MAKFPHFVCSDPRSRRRLLRSGGLGRPTPCPVKTPPAGRGRLRRPRRAPTVGAFISTDCQLTWQGITIYGAIDGGVRLAEPRRAPWDPRSAVGRLILNPENRTTWRFGAPAPNALLTQFIHWKLKETEPIGGKRLCCLLLWTLAFDPVFPPILQWTGIRLLRTPASPKTLKPPSPISSRAGQWFNGQGLCRREFRRPMAPLTVFPTETR